MSIVEDVREAVIAIPAGFVYADGTPASCHNGRALELLNDEGTPMLGARVDLRRARQRWEP